MPLTEPCSDHPRQLVLASASPARLRVLTAAGFAPEVIESGVDETVEGASDTASVVLALAKRKASVVAALLGATSRVLEVAAAGARSDGGALVVGCDSLLDVDGVGHGKPGTAAAATDVWRRLRGRSAALLTGHCIIDTVTGRQAADVASTTVRFGSPTDQEIEAYVATGEPLGVAGAFTIDGLAAPFVDGVDGDPSNVIGLSLPLFRRLLAELGVEVTSLWR